MTNVDMVRSSAAEDISTGRRVPDLYIGQGESEFLLGVPSGAMQVDLVVSHEGIEQQISLLDGEKRSGYSELFYRSDSLATTVEALIAQPANLSYTFRRNDGSNEAFSAPCGLTGCGDAPQAMPAEGTAQLRMWVDRVVLAKVLFAWHVYIPLQEVLAPHDPTSPNIRETLIAPAGSALLLPVVAIEAKESTYTPWGDCRLRIGPGWVSLETGQGIFESKTLVFDEGGGISETGVFWLYGPFVYFEVSETLTEGTLLIQPSLQLTDCPYDAALTESTGIAFRLP